MKYSKAKFVLFVLQKYGKLFSYAAFFVFLLDSCQPGFRKEKHLAETLVLEDDSITLAKQHEYIGRKSRVMTGSERLYLVLDSLKDKRVAVVGNQTSMVKQTHLVDTLLSLKINVVKVFSPEHGFRGLADAGEKVNSTNDAKTGLPIISLYGNNKKPSAEQLSDVDVILFDLQDVGVRFYTYISTLHYIMEACAEQGKRVIVLDRPNPNAHYIDGPVLKSEFKSFVGMDPVPIVYGMTIGEYALMLNGEHWLDCGLECNLWVIPCKYYTHQTFYSLPISPSPNLKTDRAIALYPSLCLFEATTVSLGRGTERPFEMYGHPKFPETGYSFTPISMPGAKTPPRLNEKCNGYDLGNTKYVRMNKLNLEYVMNANSLLADSSVFIDQNSFFDKLAGNSELRNQIHSCISEDSIRSTWQPELNAFKETRKKYLLYED